MMIALGYSIVLYNEKLTREKLDKTVSFFFLFLFIFLFLSFLLLLPLPSFPIFLASLRTKNGFFKKQRTNIRL